MDGKNGVEKIQMSDTVLWLIFFRQTDIQGFSLLRFQVCLLYTSDAADDSVLV